MICESLYVLFWDWRSYWCGLMLEGPQRKPKFCEAALFPIALGLLEGRVLVSNAEVGL